MPGLNTLRDVALRFYGRAVRIPILGGLVRLPVLAARYLLNPGVRQRDDTAERLRFLTDQVATLRERVDALEAERRR